MGILYLPKKVPVWVSEDSSDYDLRNAIILEEREIIYSTACSKY